MSPLKKLEVEPLGEERWSKIEDAVFDQLDRENLLRAEGSAPASRVSRAGTTQEPDKTAAEPRASVAPRGWRSRTPIALGAALVMAGAMAAAVGALVMRTLGGNSVASMTAPVSSTPSRIVTTSSASHLALGDSEVDVGSESAVLVSGDDDHGVLLVIDRGELDCVVAPRKGRPPFVVQAGDVRVRVGSAGPAARFSVKRAPEEGGGQASAQGAHVIVAMGIVDVTAHGQSSVVHAGETWPTSAATSAAPRGDDDHAATNDAPPPAASPAPIAAAPLDTPHRDGTRSARGQRFSADGPRSSHPSSGSSGPMRILSAPWHENAGTSGPPGQSAPAGTPVQSPLAAPPSPAPPPPAAAVKTPDPTPAPPPPPSAQEQYESAAKMEGRNPEGALAIYRNIAVGQGPWAANALYAAGRLEADRGHRADAQRLLREYLARFPHGPNAVDARDLLAGFK